MMVEMVLHTSPEQSVTLWLKEVSEAHAVVEKVLEPAREVVAITGYERDFDWNPQTGTGPTEFLPKTVYVNEFVLLVEVIEHPDEKL